MGVPYPYMWGFLRGGVFFGGSVCDMYIVFRREEFWKWREVRSSRAVVGILGLEVCMRVKVGDATHSQVLFRPKSVSVDSEVCGVLEWFNSFSEVYTIASCQGVEGGDGPYVLWFSLDPLETQLVLGRFCFKEVTRVRYDQRRNMLVYTTRWPSLVNLKNSLPFYVG